MCTVKKKGMILLEACSGKNCSLPAYLWALLSILWWNKKAQILAVEYIKSSGSNASVTATFAPRRNALLLSCTPLLLPAEDLCASPVCSSYLIYLNQPDLTKSNQRQCKLAWPDGFFCKQELGGTGSASLASLLPRVQLNYYLECFVVTQLGWGLLHGLHKAEWDFAEHPR